MADISIGDITSRLTLDAAAFLQSIQQATQALQQFQQVLQSLQGVLNSFQSALNQVSTTTLQVNQSFQQFNQTFNQTNLQFNQLNQTIQQFNQTFNQTNNQFNQTNNQFNQFNTTFNQTINNINQGTTATQGLSGAWQRFISVATITTFLEESVRLAARMEDLHRSFIGLEGSSAAATRTMQQLFDVAQRTGTGFEQTVASFRRLEGAALGTGLSQTTLLDIQEKLQVGFRALGLSTDEAGRAMTTWDHILTRNEITTRELRQIMNTVPGGLQRLADSLGVTTEQFQSLARSGMIPATVAFVAFGQSMDQVAAKAGSIEGLTTAFARFANETKVWMVAIGELISLGLVPLLETLTKISETLRSIQMPDWLKQMGNLKNLFVPTPLGEGERNVQGLAPGATPIAPSPYTALITQYARQAGLDPGLVSQLMRVETGGTFNPNLVSPRGAIGLGQLMPATARAMQPGITEAELKDPETNIRLSVRYLAEQMQRFAGNIDQVQLALAAYNAGPGSRETGRGVYGAMARAATAGRPETYAGIEPYLPPETQRYVPSVLSLGERGRATTGATTEVGGQRAGDIAQQTQAFEESLKRTNAQFDQMQKQVRDLAATTGNYNNIVGEQLRKSVEELVAEYAKMQGQLATMPELARRISPEVRAEVDERTREAVMLREALLSETARRDLLRQQVEALEQAEIQARARLLSEREGSQAAEEYTRRAMADLQARRIAEREQVAGLTTQQQIEEYQQRIVALENRVRQVGQEIQRQQAEAMRPRLESELTRIEDALGRPSTDVAVRARQRVEEQGTTMRAQLEEMQRQIARTPGLEAVQERLQNILRDFKENLATQGQEAFDQAVKAEQSSISGLGDSLEQLHNRMIGATLTPLQEAIARVNREFDAMGTALDRLEEQLTRLRRTATEEGKRAIDIQLEGIKQAREELPYDQQRALQDQRMLQEFRTIGQQASPPGRHAGSHPPYMVHSRGDFSRSDRGADPNPVRNPRPVGERLRRLLKERSDRAVDARMEFSFVFDA